MYQLAKCLFDASKVVARGMMTMSEACIQHYQQLSTIWINSAVENEKYYDKFDIRQYSAMQLLGACAGVYEVTEF